jgi:type II secretory pathway component PulF
MPFYSYTALDDNGAIVKGEIQGEDVEFACNGISSSGLHLVKIRQLSRLSESIIKTKRARGVKRSEIIELSSNLSVMVKAGLPLNTAIMDIAETIENKVFRMRIQEMARNIELGASFSTALSHHSGHCSPSAANGGPEKCNYQSIDVSCFCTRRYYSCSPVLAYLCAAQDD